MARLQVSVIDDCSVNDADTLQHVYSSTPISYIYIYTHTYIHTYIHTYTHIITYTYICACTSRHLYVCTSAERFLRLYTSNSTTVDDARPGWQGYRSASSTTVVSMMLTCCNSSGKAARRIEGRATSSRREDSATADDCPHWDRQGGGCSHHQAAPRLCSGWRWRRTSLQALR